MATYCVAKQTQFNLTVSLLEAAGHSLQHVADTDPGVSGGSGYLKKVGRVRIQNPS